MTPLPSSPPLDAWRRVSLAVAAFQRAAAAQIGVRPTDYDCLDLLLQGEPVTPSGFVALTGYTPGAVTGVIDRLVRAGLARRVSDPADGRRVFVEPVPGAIERALGPAVSALAGAIETAHDDLTEAERALVVDYLLRSATAIADAAHESARASGTPP